jgi:enoyl-CoA hydratase/carnithine racemase
MRTERAGDALTVHLDRPNKLNAMDRQAWQGLRAAVESADNDVTLRSVVIRGDRRAFCAGNDINAMIDAQQRGAAEDYFLEGMLPAFTAMATSQVPIVSVVEGQALGGGLEILCFSDIVVSSSEATFALPETRIGVFATVFLGACASTSSRRAGATLALTGRPVGADEALRLGIVTHLAAPDAVDTRLEEVLGDIRHGSRDATARTKAWLNRDLVESGLERCRAALRELCHEGMASAEYRTTVDRFLARQAAKRKPGHAPEADPTRR